jgi:hypothetical protein
MGRLNAMLSFMSAAKPKSYLDNVIEMVDGVCTGCTECGDRDTCECNFDEDLAFEAAADQEPAESLHPRAVAAKR